MSGRVIGFIGSTISERLKAFISQLRRFRPKTLTIVVCDQDIWELTALIQENLGHIEKISDEYFRLVGVKQITAPVYDDRHQIYLVYVTYAIVRVKEPSAQSCADLV